jgi:hypothetical protein
MSSTEAINNFVEGYAQLFKTGQRSPILRRPDEYGMEYEDIFFPSLMELLYKDGPSLH